MKKIVIICLMVIALKPLTGQNKSQDFTRDPFCQMISKLYDLEAVCFNSSFRIKQVFETDTVTTHARVRVKKRGNKISFLQIIPNHQEKELLFCNDSAWHVDHHQNTMYCIGTFTDQMTYNELSSFFPFTLFELDTMINHVEPFWHIQAHDSCYIVKLDIQTASDEISDINVEYEIDKSDLLLKRALQQSTYMKLDNLFQEQIFSHYTFPQSKMLQPPDYFFFYEKDLGIIESINTVPEIAAEAIDTQIVLQNIDIKDFRGNEYKLPDSGLIFIDLWYVGCAPCMRSAPVIERIYLKYNTALHFISVNETDHDTLKINSFREKMGISFPVLVGAKGRIAEQVSGARGYPLFILLDGTDKRVLWHFTGFSEELEKLIESEIVKFLRI